MRCSSAPREETVWEGALTDVIGEPPLGVPGGVWTVARALVNGGNGDNSENSENEAGQTSAEIPEDLDRHVIARRLRLTCIPVTHVEYSFDGRAFAFTSVGPSGSERFWADEFPARWTRVGRFFKAVMRDLNGERDERRRLPGGRHVRSTTCERAEYASYLTSAMSLMSLTPPSAISRHGTTPARTAADSGSAEG